MTIAYYRHFKEGVNRKKQRNRLQIQIFLLCHIFAAPAVLCRRFPGIFLKALDEIIHGIECKCICDLLHRKIR